MRYRITYKVYDGKWDEKIVIFPSSKHLANHVSNMRKKGFTNIITQEYYDNSI